LSPADTFHPPAPGKGQGGVHLVRRLLRAGWRTLDGALLLGLGWLARCWPRGKHGRGLVLVTNTMAIGGAQQQIVTWLQHGSRGHEPVWLVLLTAEANTLVEVSSLGVPVEAVEALLASRVFRRRLLAAVPRTAYVWALWRLLRRHRPAVVWSWLFLANVVAAPAARLAGIHRVICSERGLSTWKWRGSGGLWWYRPAEQTAAALSDVLVVNARAVARDYARWLGRSPHEVRVVANGIDPARWSGGVKTTGGAEPAAKKSRVPIILNVGRLCPEKAQATLIRVCARLLETGSYHRLVLVGGGEMAEALRKTARELGVEHAVRLAGEVRDPSEFYREADVFALSSVAEGMPNALMEAQLCGLPAVTTDAGGAGEVVVDGETGFVVPVGDEAAFAAALQRLLEDPELRRRMGEAGRRRMLDVFSVERMVREMDQLFAELGVVGGRAGGG